MGIVFSIIFVVVFFVIGYIVARKFEQIAFQKGYGTEVHSFAMCFWLAMIGYIYVLALPDLTARELIKNNSAGEL